MKIILLQDLPDTLYKKYEVIDVAAGFANNYLLPNHLAKVANRTNIIQLREQVKQATHKAAQDKIKAETQARSLQEIPLIFYARTSKDGKIFGSITKAQIKQFLTKKNGDIQVTNLTIPDNIQTVGNYPIQFTLYPGIDVNVEITIASL